VHVADGSFLIAGICVGTSGRRTGARRAGGRSSQSGAAAGPVPRGRDSSVNVRDVSGRVADVTDDEPTGQLRGYDS